MLNDIRATLAISKEEAHQGTSRTLTLPAGRQVSVTIPPGTSDGQIMHLDAQTGSSAQAGSADLLVLTIAVTAPPNPVADPMADAATLHADIGLGRRNAVNASIASQAQLTLKSEQPPTAVNHAGMLPLPAPYQTLSATPSPRNPRSSTTKLVLLIALVLLLIGGSVSAFYYFSNSRGNGTAGGPAATATALAQGLTATSSGQNNDAATSTAITQVNANGTATVQANQANTDATTQANATATAQVNVTATAQVVATATALAQQNPYGGTLAFSDPMSDNSGGHNWAETGGCQFSGGAYHVTAAANYNNVCHGQNTNYSNFAMQAQLTFISSGQHFSGLGFVFRSDGNYNEYELTIFERGTYSLTLCKYTNPGADCSHALAQGTCPSWHAGLNNPNTVAIVANGSDISLYVNGKRIAHGSDTTYTQGQIGFLSTGGDATTEGAISNLKVWTL
ncbi:MAG TPA: hypothetical protein VFB60_22045 [Ktedonobacteraceae bacterium]|nr:hypothetical protein [Ktedonobacteraceae bacterium]